MKGGGEDNRQSNQYVTIRVLEDIPLFQGVDGKSYELKEGEIVKIPKINAIPLIKRGKAKEVKAG